MIRNRDAFVVCTPGRLSSTVATGPVAVFAMLSPCNSSSNHFVTNREYRDTPSIQGDVIVAQDIVGASVFAQAGDDWPGPVLGADRVPAMPEAGIEMPMNEPYEGDVVEPTDTKEM